MDRERAKQLVDLLDEVIWRFGSQGSDGYCCEDISYVEYRTLKVLAKVGFLTMQQLGQQLGFTKSGATRVVDRLEAAGYVRRERSEYDHRVCCVTLTDAGRELLERVVEEYARKVEMSLERLDPDMQDVLMASLRSFVRTFCGG
ncbi:MAG: MarR family transcriptional regulator [Armatimonadota bacterium]|nr:MarR family transcriptional regulator [Armatimonadota bacterium]